MVLLKVGIAADPTVAAPCGLAVELALLVVPTRRPVLLFFEPQDGMRRKEGEVFLAHYRQVEVLIRVLMQR